MKRLASLAFFIVFSLGLSVSAEEVSLLIQLGLKDKEGTDWSGSAVPSVGKVSSITGWRFEQKDSAAPGKGTWECRTRQLAVKGRANNPKKLGMAKRQNLGPIAENGVILGLRQVEADTTLAVHTPQGDFTVKLSDVPYGKLLPALDGAVTVQRCATGAPMTTERTEDDYPAMAVAKNAGYLVYQSFTPGIDRDERAKRWDAEPADLSFLAKPVGGDQLWLRLRNGGQWDEAIAVTEIGRDIYKSSVAVDGQGAGCIVWSERVEGQFDIFTRTVNKGKLGEIKKLSEGAGNDLSPVAATDSTGHVWVAWMAAEEKKFTIFTAHQTDAGWSKPAPVSINDGNCWNPAIAADATGRVAIAWDTYAKGDYDIWLCLINSADGKAEAPQPVANSYDYEARATLTFDASNALWVAWEQSGQTWGKDWGAYDSNDGIGLYRDRSIGMKVLKDGQWMQPVGNVASGLPGSRKEGRADEKVEAPAASPEGPNGIDGGVTFLEPAARKGEPGGHAEAKGNFTFNNLGRLVCDVEGRLWCIARSRLNSFRPQLGSVFVSYATYLDGDHWVGPIFIPNSDNLLYNTPAVAAGAKAVLVAHSTDHRQTRQTDFAAARQPATKGGNASLGATSDPFDNDIILTRLMLQGTPAAVALKPATPMLDNPEPSKRTVAERAEVAACRDYTASVGGKTLHIYRGEFHRHTEISGDGGNDGPLEDMWRYGIDASMMDWLGNGDHDNGSGREYTWWLTQKTTDAFHLPGSFTPMFTYERSVSYPEGHRNVVFAQRGVRTLPRLPISDRNVFAPAPDTTMLYHYLHLFKGVCASHTSVGTMGTDWRNNDPEVEPFVEVYQGARQNYEYAGCPRCPTADDAIGGWEPAGFINNAFAKGYRLAFESSSDHGSTHISYALIYAEDSTREGILKAMRLRHTYGATDNIIADIRCKAADGTEHMMGEEFAVKAATTLNITLIGTAPFARVVVIKDNVEIPLDAPKDAKTVKLTWTDPSPSTADKTSYYYVRGEQTNSELVWASPMWIKAE